MPNAEYAPKLECHGVLVKTVVISELVGVRCGDIQMLSVCSRMNVKSAVCFTVIGLFIFLGILIFFK